MFAIMPRNSCPYVQRSDAWRANESGPSGACRVAAPSLTMCS
jgi:hypothetical protein